MIKKKAALRRWIIFEMVDQAELELETLKYVGAYAALVLLERRVPKNAYQAVYKLQVGDREFLNLGDQRMLANLLLKAKQEFSNTSNDDSNFENTIKGFYRYRQIYADAKVRQSVLDRHTLAENEFLDACKSLSDEAKNNNHFAVQILISSLTGLPTHLSQQLPLVDHNLNEWVVALDVNRGVILFDLDLISPHKANPRENHALYEKASSILVKPIPRFLHNILKDLIKNDSVAKNVGELLKDEDQNSHFNFSTSKFINSVARFATHYCEIDPYDAANLVTDFRSIPSSKTYYRNTTRQSVWESSRVYFDYVGWGDPVDFVDGVAVGSRVVPTIQSVRLLFEKLSIQLNESRPHSRAKIDHLLKFHDSMCAYSSTLAIFCLALRNSNPITINSSDLVEDKSYILIDDKHAMGEASNQPVVITPTLSKQFGYWFLHCEALIKRLSTLNFTDIKFIEHLQSIVDHKKVTLFSFSQHPYIASVSGVASYWTVPLVENFSRHFWETHFLELGVHSRFSAAQLRHQISGNLNWSSSSDLVLSEFTKLISSAQEKALSALGIFATHGLTKRIYP